MFLFGFGNRSRRRRTKRRGSKRSKSRKHRHSRKSRRVSYRKRRSSKIQRVGNKVNIIGRGGKIKSFKVKTNMKNGRDYYVSGKRKTKHYLTAKRRTSRRFGSGKDSLLNMMGNFSPAEMSLAQSTTGMSAPQMQQHLNGISRSDLSNFYTNIQ